jgi:hypothetical protein
MGIKYFDSSAEEASSEATDMSMTEEAEEEESDTEKYVSKTLHTMDKGRFRALVHYFRYHSNIAEMQCELYRSTDYTYSLALITVMMFQHRTQLRKLRKYRDNRTALFKELSATLDYYSDIAMFGKTNMRSFLDAVKIVIL